MKFNFKNLNRKRLFIGIGAGAAIVIIVLANLSFTKTTDGPDVGPPVDVQVENVRRMSVEQTVTAAGTIQPVIETEISSNVSAQIIAILVEEGDEVQVGDTLVILDRLRYEAAYERSRSALRSATAREKQVRSERARGRQLFEKNLISLQEMEALEASYEMALSQKEQAEASLDQVQDDLNKTILMAPEAGVVTRLNKEVGEMALGSTFQADVLLIIADLSLMEVVVEVDETDVVDIQLGNLVKIEIDAIQDSVFAGKVSQIAHSATILGQGTQSQVTNFEVEVTLAVSPEAQRIDPRIRPGMSATTTITTALKESTIAIPIQALTARQPKRPELEGDEAEDQEVRSQGDQTQRAAMRGSGMRGAGGGMGGGRGSGDMGGSRPGNGRSEPVEVVFVIATDSTQSDGGFFQKLFGMKPQENVEQREVKLGISSDTHYEIVAGLRPGEEIVTGNYQAVSKDLKDGSPIERKERLAGGRQRP